MRIGRGVYLLLIALFVVAVGFYFTAVNPVTRYLHEGLDLKGGVHVVLQAEGHVTEADMKKILTIMTFRANAFGVSEPVIQQAGSRQVIVELPGIKNQEQAIRTIGRTAQLVFKDPSGKVILTGDELVRAQAEIQGPGSYVVGLTFNAKGTAAFARATSRLVGQRIAIYLDKHLIENPVVEVPITNGQAVITGFPSLQSAQSMASLLNSGALPVPMKIVEVRTVSATLGADSIRASEMAGLVAMVLIGGFMVVFYRFAGLLADLALVVYLMLVIAILIAMNAVITLPGVAGIILSAGIAVDANVIIFARVRDELRAGRTLGAALDHGFRHAFRAILDSNVSALLAAGVLYYLGTGEIRGFAVTLAVGVAVSFVTAVSVTRFLLRLAEDTAVARNLPLFLGGVGGRAA